MLRLPFPIPDRVKFFFFFFLNPAPHRRDPFSALPLGTISAFFLPSPGDDLRIRVCALPRIEPTLSDPPLPMHSFFQDSRRSPPLLLRRGFFPFVSLPPFRQQKRLSREVEKEQLILRSLSFPPDACPSHLPLRSGQEGAPLFSRFYPISGDHLIFMFRSGKLRSLSLYETPFPRSKSPPFYFSQQLTVCCAPPPLP